MSTLGVAHDTERIYHVSGDTPSRLSVQLMRRPTTNTARVTVKYRGADTAGMQTAAAVILANDTAQLRILSATHPP